MNKSRLLARVPFPRHTDRNPGWDLVSWRWFGSLSTWWLVDGVFRSFFHGVDFVEGSLKRAKQRRMAFGKDNAVCCPTTPLACGVCIPIAFCVLRVTLHSYTSCPASCPLQSMSGISLKKEYGRITRDDVLHASSALDVMVSLTVEV
jgi:hypothetical protein